MLVFASPRLKGSEEILLGDLHENYLTATISKLGGDSLISDTLQRTLSARMRRRERVISELNIFHHVEFAYFFARIQVTFSVKIICSTNKYFAEINV